MKKYKLARAKVTMSKFPEFANYKSSLEETHLQRGHIMLMQPTCHAEMAGEGIECCWGKAKHEFRRHTNTRSSEPEALLESVLTALSSKEHVNKFSKHGAKRPAPLPLWRTRHFARHCRRCMSQHKGPPGERHETPLDFFEHMKAVAEKGNNSFDSAEKSIKEAHSHRGALDSDWAFCTNSDPEGTVSVAWDTFLGRLEGWRAGLHAAVTDSSVP